jgi:hypothetical protein
MSPVAQARRLLESSGWLVHPHPAGGWIAQKGTQGAWAESLRGLVVRVLGLRA